MDNRKKRMFLLGTVALLVSGLCGVAVLFVYHQPQSDNTHMVMRKRTVPKAVVLTKVEVDQERMDKMLAGIRRYGFENQTVLDAMARVPRHGSRRTDRRKRPPLPNGCSCR